MRQKMFKLPKTKKIGIITIILTLTMGVGSSSWLSSHCEVEPSSTFSRITLRGDLK